ncbi:hypothetical protein ACP70R_026426 [Stipagrostis hirtigluma subsp. patula]
MASSSSFSSSIFHIEPLDGGETCRRADMDACALCGKRLAGDRDMFMYRGDTPFCSEECRNGQIVRDEVGARKNTPSDEHPARKEQQHQRHGTPAAETAHVKLAANVPVAI